MLTDVAEILASFFQGLKSQQAIKKESPWDLSLRIQTWFHLLMFSISSTCTVKMLKKIISSINSADKIPFEDIKLMVCGIHLPSKLHLERCLDLKWMLDFGNWKLSAPPKRLNTHSANGHIKRSVPGYDLQICFAALHNLRKQQSWTGCSLNLVLYLSNTIGRKIKTFHGSPVFAPSHGHHSSSKHTHTHTHRERL